MKRSPLLVIFTTVVIDLIGFGIVIPVLPFYVESTRFNASPREAGLLFAAYSVMQFIFSPILGKLSDRYGRRPVLLFSIIGTGIGFLILGAANTLWMLFVGRILDGITGGNISTAYAYVADITTREDRAKGMGMLGAAFGLGFVLGPAIGGVMSKWGISVPFFFAAGLAFFNSILIYFLLPESLTPGRKQHQPSAGRFYLLQASGQTNLLIVLAIYFLSINAFSIMTTVFSFYTMYRFNYDVDHNGYIFAFIGLIAIMVQGGLLSQLAKRYGELILSIIGSLLLALGFLILPLLGPNSGGLSGLLIIVAVLAVGNSLLTPSLTSLASKSVEAEKQGMVMGILQSTGSLGRAIGPIIGAFLIYAADVPRNMNDYTLLRTFVVASAIMFAAFVLAIYFARAYDENHADVSRPLVAKD
jgi:multidrug resistance protein